MTMSNATASSYNGQTYEYNNLDGWDFIVTYTVEQFLVHEEIFICQAGTVVSTIKKTVSPNNSIAVYIDGKYNGTHYNGDYTAFMAAAQGTNLSKHNSQQSHSLNAATTYPLPEQKT